MPESVVSTYERYFAGDYERSCAEARACLSENPTLLDMYLILSKGAAILGRRLESPFADGCPADQLLTAVAQLTERRRNFEQARDNIGRLALALNHSALADGLFALLAHETDGNRNGVAPDAYYVSTGHVAPTMARMFAPAGRGRFLAALSARSEMLADQLRAQSAADFDEGRVAGLSPRSLRHLARDLEASGRPSAAADLYRRTLASLPSRAVHVATVRGLHRCALVSNDLVLAAQLVVDNMITDPQVLDPSSARQTRDALRNCVAVQESPIVWPLLVFASEYESSSPDRIAVHDALDDALTMLGAARPSELLNGLVPRDARLWFLLARVATQDVLDSSWHYPSLVAVEDERIMLCRAVVEECGVAEMRQFAEAELNAVALARFRRKAAQHLRQSRIYVDKPSLLRMMRRRLAELYSRYVEYSRLDSSLRIRLREEGVELDPETTVILADASLLMFSSLFDALRDAYVSSNEHGLDAYLSIRLRHGTLVAELRSPLEAEHLVTKKEGPGRYARNAYYMSTLFADFDPDTIAAGVDRGLS